MPAIVAFFARQLVIIGAQLGIFVLIDKFVTPLLNTAVSAIVQAFGVSESVAHDILANEIITTAESLGLTVALSKAKLPLVLADKLGFSTRGFSKRKIPAATEAKIQQAKGVRPANAQSTAEAIQTGATAIASKKSTTIEKVQAVASLIIAGLGVPVGVGLLITNTIDFGAWSSSAYQGQFQRFLSFFGLTPDRPTATPRTVSQDVFLKVYVALKNEGATQIRNPYTEETVPYTEANFAAIVDKLASHIFIETGSVSAKQLLGAVLVLVDIKKGGASAAPVPLMRGPTGAAPAPSVRVFSGVVSQGVVGGGLQFAARPDDLIESTGELQDAAHNNLAAVVASLSSSLVYEIKIVPTITTKDGFTLHGQTQRIVSGTHKDGTPKFRTVVNKFAVLTVYILTERGARTKYRTIVLGPVDALRFQPTNEDLARVEGAVKKDLVTSDFSIVSAIATSTRGNIAIPDSRTATSQDSTAQFGTGAMQFSGATSGSSPLEPTAAQLAARLSPVPFVVQYPTTGMFRDVGDFGSSIWRRVGDKYYQYNLLQAELVPNISSIVGAGNQSGVARQTLRERYGVDWDTLPRFNLADILPRLPQGGYVTLPTIQQFLDLGPAVATDAMSATSLLAFYSARGQSLPTIAARAELYASLGLGQAAFYTGTAEQNTKLLAALKVNS